MEMSQREVNGVLILSPKEILTLIKQQVFKKLLPPLLIMEPKKF